MKPIFKIKLKILLFDVLFELLVDSIIFVFAYFSDRLLEVIVFYLSWNIIYRFFPKVFHFKFKTPFQNVIGCAICSCMCYFIYLKLSLPISISIFSGVLYGVFAHFILYKIQDYIELKNNVFKNSINIYNMSEEELRNYAKSKGLSEMIIDTLILRVINNYKWVEIQKERNYTKEGIRYHKERICKILDVKL